MALIDVPARIWNDIAATNKLQTPWAKAAFLEDAIHMARRDCRDYLALIRQFYPHNVAAAFLDMRPLLWEAFAIRQYIVEKSRFSLRRQMPEITTVEQAVRVASLDRPLSESERRLLADLLTSLQLQRQGALDDDRPPAIGEALRAPEQVLHNLITVQTGARYQ